MSSYVSFTPVEVSAPRKTKIWAVYSIRGAILGEVRWYSPWRCYSFYPAEGTIFNAGCMVDIARFCVQQTTTHRGRVKRASAEAH